MHISMLMLALSWKDHCAQVLPQRATNMTEALRACSCSGPVFCDCGDFVILCRQTYSRITLLKPRYYCAVHIITIAFNSPLQGTCFFFLSYFWSGVYHFSTQLWGNVKPSSAVYRCCLCDRGINNNTTWKHEGESWKVACLTRNAIKNRFLFIIVTWQKAKSLEERQ